jgi:DNA-sulfur modification-associated
MRWLVVTFTTTAEELADAAENRLLWTDQDVQRGIIPGLPKPPPRELSLADGSPDPQFYVFDATNAGGIVEKLLGGERLFLSPLVWNLRPGMFEAFWNPDNAELYIYSGKIYLPDSHHRQQAIVRAVQIGRDARDSYPKFSPAKQFKVELYFLSKEDEGNYCFDKNQRPKPTAKSEAYDLAMLDDLARLAKKVIEKSAALKDNVNRVTGRLTAKNPQVITLSTLREMMKSLASTDALDVPEMEGLATVAATFYDMLAKVRPESGELSPSARRAVREKLIVDAAVMMHGSAALIRDLNDSIGVEGVERAVADWSERLERFAAERKYSFDRWSGDLFEKSTPLWQRVGVVKPGRDGKRRTVLNTGAARSECGRVLRQLASLDHPQMDLMFLANR